MTTSFTILEVAMLIGLSLNAYTFVKSYLAWRQMNKMVTILLWICMNSYALRHVGKVQLYSMLAVLDRESLRELRR